MSVQTEICASTVSKYSIQTSMFALKVTVLRLRISACEAGNGKLTKSVWLITCVTMRTLTAKNIKWSTSHLHVFSIWVSVATP